MAYCVPYLQSDGGVAIDGEYFGGVFYSNSDIILFAELSFDVTIDQTGFSNA